MSKGSNLSIKLRRERRSGTAGGVLLHQSEEEKYLHVVLGLLVPPDKKARKMQTLDWKLKRRDRIYCQFICTTRFSLMGSRDMQWLCVCAFSVVNIISEGLSAFAKQTKEDLAQNACGVAFILHIPENRNSHLPGVSEL